MIGFTIWVVMCLSPLVFYGNGCLNWFNCNNRDLVYFDIEQQVLKTLPFNLIDKSGEEWKDDFIKYFGASMGRMY